MRIPPRNDLFSRCVRERYAAEDPWGICPICGDYVFWPRQRAALDANGQIFHEECKEEIDDAGDDPFE
ncbi:MAG: hypothetical protein K2P20_02490 [Oscillospiraceae bacterium]|nr:hypothetical protein [Oscillospiraceae bacterium]